MRKLAHKEQFHEFKSHKFTRIVLFLSAFSWTLNPIGDYVDGGAPIEKVLTRMLPLLWVFLYSLAGPYRNQIRRFFSGDNALILWYIIWGSMSGILSISPGLSLWKGMEIFILTLWITISCRDRESCLRELHAFVTMVEILLWITLVLAFVNPAMGFRKAATIIPWLQGYYPLLNPNAVGILSAVALMRLVFFPSRRKSLRILIMATTLIMSQSRTAFVSVTVGMGIFTYAAIRAKELERVIIALAASFVSLALALGMLDFFMGIFMRGQSTDEFSSLSGRTRYWEFALSQVDYVGGGFAVGVRFFNEIGNDVFYKSTVNLHNSFLEAAISAGLIGSIPYFFLYIRKALKQLLFTFIPKYPEDLFFTALLIIIVFRSMTSVVMGIYSADMIYLMMFWAYRLHSRSPSQGQQPPQTEHPSIAYKASPQ